MRRDLSRVARIERAAHAVAVQGGGRLTLLHLKREDGGGQALQAEARGTRWLRRSGESERVFVSRVEIEAGKRFPRGDTLIVLRGADPYAAE